MYLDLSCPLELLSFELMRDHTGKVRAYLTLNNLSGHLISRIEGHVHWIDTENQRRSSAPFVADRLRARSQSPFRIQLSTAHCPGADQVEVTFSRLRFSKERPDWRGDPRALIRIETPSTPPGRELNKLLAAAGYDAQNFPLSTDNYWLCLCGRPNPSPRTACRRCRRKKDEVFKRFTRKKVLLGKTPAAFPDKPKIQIHKLSRKKANDRATVEAALSHMGAQYLAERKKLVRRSISLAVVILLTMLITYALSWLSEKQELARHMRPVTKIDSPTSEQSTLND